MSCIHLVSNTKLKWKRAGIFVSLFCFVLLSSCAGGGDTIAKVNDIELNREDAEMLMEHLGYDINNKNDWNTFLEQWTRNQALKQELEISSPEKAKLVQLRSDQYAGELSNYYLEDLMIMKKLDTVITEKEMISYFEANKSSFSLQDYLVQALYIKVPKEVKVVDKLKSAYLLKNDKDLNQVNSYAKLYAENFYFDDEQWIYFTELTKDIPLQQYNIDNIVLNRTKTYFSDEEFIYFLNIIDYKLKDETPPLDFLKPRIREIILSGRVNKLREKLDNTLYTSIQKKHDIKIYYH